MLLTKTEPAGIRGAVCSTVSTSGFSDLRSRCALSQKPSGDSSSQDAYTSSVLAPGSNGRESTLGRPGKCIKSI